LNAAIKPRVSAAVRSRDETIVNLLGSLQRIRDLDQGETALLERTVRRLTPPREIWRWSAQEDLKLKAFIKRRSKTGRPRPFEGDDEVRQLAESMGRTYWAVHRRIERLRKKCNLKPVKFYRASTRRAVVKEKPAPAPMPEGTVGEKEAAAMLGVSMQWLKRLRLVGGGPAYVKGPQGSVRYTVEGLKRFPAQQIADENRCRGKAWLRDTVQIAIDLEAELTGRKCSDAAKKRKA
jgi:hypothetical protein